MPKDQTMPVQTELRILCTQCLICGKRGKIEVKWKTEIEKLLKRRSNIIWRILLAKRKKIITFGLFFARSEKYFIKYHL